jgi:hypothetical protein
VRDILWAPESRIKVRELAKQEVFGVKRRGPAVQAYRRQAR